MNERILELAEQAETYAWQQIDEGAAYDEHPRYFTEKFAELIVRECAEVARLNTRVDSKVYLMIKEHFGVEE